MGRDNIQTEIVPFDKIPKGFHCELPVLLSPGPNDPASAWQTIEFARRSIGLTPILGICLGHQILGQLAGGVIRRSDSPLHGSARRIRVLAGGGLFKGLSLSFEAGSYNSLVVDVKDVELVDGWEVSAVCDGGECQALSFSKPGSAPAFGTQFHPESFLSSISGLAIRDNFIKLCRQWLESH